MSSVNNSFVFCPPLPGKPDPKQNKPEGFDNRNRVYQAEVKGPVCWVRVFDFIRDRIKAPNTTDTPQRQIELLASERKRNIRISIIANTLMSDPDYVVILESFKVITKKALKAIGSSVLTAYSLDDTMKKNIRMILPYFERQNTHANLWAYLNDKKNESQAAHDLKFLEKIGDTPQQHLDFIATTSAEIHGYIFNNKKFNELNATLQEPLLDGAARQATAKLFGLTLSKWAPSNTIESLIEELKTNGPLALLGDFGYDYYPTTPNLFKTIQFTDITGNKQERKTYFWPSTVSRKDRDPDMDAHAVLIVGAEKVPSNKVKQAKDQELVYYIDPYDASDPKSPDSQRILVMSLNRVRESCSDIYGFCLAESPFGYSYYNPNFFQKRLSDTTTTSLANLSLNENSNNVTSNNNNNSYP